MLKDGCADSEDYAKHLPVWIQSSFFLAAIWGFGGALSLESREQFDAFFRDLWRGIFRFIHDIVTLYDKYTITLFLLILIKELPSWKTNLPSLLDIIN